VRSEAFARPVRRVERAQPAILKRVVSVFSAQHVPALPAIEGIRGGTPGQSIVTAATVDVDGQRGRDRVVAVAREHERSQKG